MPSSKKLPPTVWVSEAIRSVKNIFSIGLGFPPEIYDYPTYYALFWKENKSKWRDSTVVFTEEDGKKSSPYMKAAKNSTARSAISRSCRCCRKSCGMACCRMTETGS